MEEKVSGVEFAAEDTYGDSVTLTLKATIRGVGKFYEAFDNAPNPYHYMVEEYGLGHGWRLGFSAIEKYVEDFGESSCYRLILSDGRRLNLKSNFTFEDYELNDMSLVKDGRGYPGAAYTLEYQDGKREYFDADGRNIAIVDRFGNAIRLEYTTDDKDGVVTQIKITDTLGNVVIYKAEELNLDPNDPYDSRCVPGLSWSDGEYNRKWTLWLNGTRIKTYYSYEDSDYDHMCILKVVENELGEYTCIESDHRTVDFNCLFPSPTTNDGEYMKVQLSSVILPNGTELNLSHGAALSARLSKIWIFRLCQTRSHLHFAG